VCAQTCTVGQPVEDQTTEVTTDFQTQKSKCKRCRYYILGPVIKQYNALNLAWHELTILIRNSAVMRDVLHFAGNNQSVDFCRLREEAGWKLFLPATTTACRASYTVHWRCKDARSYSSRVDYCNTVLYSACAAHSRPFQSVLNGWSSTTHRRKAQVRPHHNHASRPPIAAGATTYPVQAVYTSK